MGVNFAQVKHMELKHGEEADICTVVDIQKLWVKRLPVPIV